MKLAPTDYDFGSEGNFDFARSITCANDEARKLWARAWGFLLNYNHEEAIACFQECAEKDPTCAMSYWGIAYALSPTYNWPPGLGSGFDPIQKALTLLDGKTELEVDLIQALAKRHSAEARDSANPLEMKMGNDPALGPKYCDAMKPIYEKHRNNADVTALYVEGLMNLKPWTLWEKNLETGEITSADENTDTIVSVLEDTFEEQGYKHPGLCHLYIHCMELSPWPERALPAADALRTLMPDAGHLVHMPSHIDAWVGQWKEGLDCNVAGVAADDKYVQVSGKDSMFYKFYRMHNMHFVVWCAMFEGNYSKAMEYSRKIGTYASTHHRFTCGHLAYPFLYYLECFPQKATCLVETMVSISCCLDSFPWALCSWKLSCPRRGTPWSALGNGMKYLQSLSVPTRKSTLVQWQRSGTLGALRTRPKAW